MITLQSRTHVAGVSGAQIIDFLLNCDDAEYQRWWPGTHLHFHTLRFRPGDVGNTIFMDEMIGRRRVRFTGVVTELIPGKKLVWQWKHAARLVLEFQDDAKGVRITHTLCAGFPGPGRLLDPILRKLYLTKEFARAMDDHVHDEFPRLAALLRASAAREQAELTGALVH